MIKKIFIVVFILVSSLFAGCLSGNTAKASGDNVVLEVKPSEVSVKDGAMAELKIRVTNNGKSSVHPNVRFNMNSSDRPYLDFSPESYDMGNLRAGEDSGWRIVDIKGRLAAGREIKYQVKAQVIYNGAVLDSKDIVMTVTG